MDRPHLGRLEKVDLRTCWQREDTELTPWLATSENIALLAEALGFTELVVEETEVNVGPFRADVLCRDGQAPPVPWFKVGLRWQWYEYKIY